MYRISIMVENLVTQIRELTIELLEAVIKAFIFVLLFFEDIKLIVIAMMLLIAFDQFTGVWKAIKFKEFNWKKFNRLYTKLILYIIALMATYILEKQIITTDEYPFTKGLAIIIGTQEVISIYSNISITTGKKYIKEYVNVLKDKLVNK